MKLLITCSFVISVLFATAQSPITDHFDVKGSVENELSITFADIRKHAEVELGDIIIYNHNGEVVKTVHQVKGVLLKEALKEVVVNTPNYRELGIYYLLCTANDGYAATFSWNEVFNANDVYVMTEVDGEKLEQYGKSIQLFSVRDLQSGRRFIRGIQQIEVKKG